MRNILLSVSFSGALLCATLATNAQGLDCESPQTTVDMKQCLSIELADEDRELNRVYKALRADQDNTANGLLKAAQRSWIEYRDNECTRLADVTRGGTMAGILEMSCHVQMTKTRTEELATNPVTGEIDY